VAVAGASLLVPTRVGDAAVTTLTVTPAADTYVGADAPSTPHGSSTHVLVDGSPQRQSFLRFVVSGTNGRPVTDVRLRLYQLDQSSTGGRVFSISSTTWPESMTWSTKPAIDGPLRATFGAVAKGAWYEVGLGPVVAGDGVVSLAMDSTSSDGSDWATRETATPPQLVVQLGDPPPPPDDGLTTVADASTGSGEPTFYNMNHRLVTTATGRRLTVYGRHATGVQLAWRDPSRPWSTLTRGGVVDGLLLWGTGTGDWPSSIAVANGSDGRQHAWVMWAGTGGYGETPRPLELRRLSDLDHPDGPVVGPVVRVDGPGFGQGKADLALYRGADGVTRGYVVWNRRLTSSDTTSELVVTTFTGVEGDAPRLGAPVVLWKTSNVRPATLVSGPSGVRLVARTAAGRLVVYRHDPASGWVKGPDGPAVANGIRPAAGTLPDGSTLVAAQADGTNHVVTVTRFASDLAAQPAELTLSGYFHPTLAVSGSSTVVVAVRASDGFVVSRQRTATGWTGTDRVELGAEGGGRYTWPNAVGVGDGRLQFVVGGAGAASNRSSVLAWSRTL
jgi:hypothetical protein